MSFGKSKSSTNPGYFDLFTDPKKQTLDQAIYGSAPYEQAGQWSPKGFAGGSGYKWNPAGAGGEYGGAELPGVGGGGQQAPGQAAGGGGGYLFGDGSRGMTTAQPSRTISSKTPGALASGQSSYAPSYAPSSSGQGGLFGDYLGKAGKNEIFTGLGGEYTPYASTYDPANYDKQTAKQFMFSNPNLTETTLTPDEYQASQDMIQKAGKRLAEGNIAKMREADAYRGGGDLADYKAARENRNVAESVADQARQLAEDYQRRLYEDRQGVKRFGAEAEMKRQQSQAAEDARTQDFAAQQAAAEEEARRFGEQASQFGESSRQFGKDYETQYKQAQLAEQLQNTSALMELMKLMSGNLEASKEGASQSSKSTSFGMG